MPSILQSSQLPLGSCLRAYTFAQILAKVFSVALSLKARSGMQNSELRWMHWYRKIFKVYCWVEKANVWTINKLGCKSTHENCTKCVYTQKATLVTARRGWNGVEATWVTFAQKVFWSFFFFLLRNCFFILFVQLKNSRWGGRGTSKCNFAFIKWMMGSFPGKLKRI